MRLAICDDNELQREMISDVINEYIRERRLDVNVSVFESGLKLIDSVRTQGRYDIYILDMLMPEMNGLEVASTLRMLKDDGKIIFLTATLDYAVASYDVRAFYYLVKPVDKGRLFRVLDNAVGEMREKVQHLIIKSKLGDIIINTAEIMYVDLYERCPHYHMKDGRIAIGQAIRTSFKETLMILIQLKNFAACGVTTLVNLDYIEAMRSDCVTLRDGTALYPSRSCYPELNRTWKEYKTKN